MSGGKGQRAWGTFSIFGHSLLEVLGSRLYETRVFVLLLGFGVLQETERCFEKKPFSSFVLFCGAYFRGLTLWLMGTFKAKCKALFTVRDQFSFTFSVLACFGNRGCFGCFSKPSLIIAVDEPSKGLTIQGRKVKRSSFSEDFWSSSACEMERSAVTSQRSVSSISISNQSLDPSGSTSHHSEFVNHGLLLWNQTRQQWLGNNKRSEKRAQLREPTISWDSIYESLRGNNMPFPQPTPLPEMVDFLVDVWEQEGLYD
ncbi:hypothetical protein PTKIN_Ptkin03bG0184800 [Pterospermum kingtungense]